MTRVLSLMAPIISIADWTFCYKGKASPALMNIRASVEEGSLTCILGEEGAGKSSLCYSLNGLIPRFFQGTYQGKILVKGREAAKQKVAALSHQVGLVLQDFEAQLFSTNVELEMAFGPENLALPRPEIEKRLQRYLPKVGLEKLRRREPASLSGGQKQRLAIGSLLTLEPPILVMDEPTTDLDPLGAEEVLAVVRTLRQKGHTLLMVLPEPELAVEADQVWLMSGGQVRTQGPPQRILRDLPALAACGIKPPALTELFRALGWPGDPLLLPEAMTLINRHQLARPRENPSHPETIFPKRGPGLIQAEGLEYVYPLYDQKALKGIDLTIAEGEFVAILGQNGSGKSTLAKHFNGLLKPTAGRLLIEGRPSMAYSPKNLARKVGYIFQNPDHQIFCRTVEEEVGFGPKVLGTDPASIRKRVAEALETVGLQGYEKQMPFTLTKGERQRIAVASVLAVRPQVIILDEPTTGLDFNHQRRIMDLFKGLNQKGHTIILITHSMWVAAEYAKRTIILKEGAVLLDGLTRRVFAEESLLAQTALKPPPLVQLSNRLGTQALTLTEMVQELRS